MNYADLFRATLPETALEIAALLVIVVDLGFLRKAALQIRTAVAAFIGVAGCVAAIWAVYAAGWAGFSAGSDLAARGRRLGRRRAGRHPRAHRAHVVASCRLRLHAQPRRVRLCRADGRGRRPDHLRRAGSAGDLRRPRTAVARPLHPHRLRQAIRQKRRSRDQVLPLRRNVGGVSALRLQLSLRAFAVQPTCHASCSAPTWRRPTAARRCSISRWS